MTNSEAITIAICSDGRSRHLHDAVSAALEQTYAQTTVLVIDNDPPSGLVRARLRDVDHPRLHIVDEPRRGLSHARNRALRRAQAPLITFTDDDSIAELTWVEHLVGAFAADPTGDVACVTGRVTADRLKVDEHRWFEEGFGFDKGPQAFSWSLSEPQASSDTPSSPEPGPRGLAFPYAGGELGSGNNMAFRTDWLRRRGGFDEALGAGSPARGGEDLDAFRAVLLSGATLKYEPAAHVRHRHRDDMTRLTRQAFGYGAGMAASVTVLCCRNPRHLLSVVRLIPAAAGLLLRSDSTKNAGKSADYPPRLDRVERLGYLVGPLLALAGLLRASRSTRE